MPFAWQEIATGSPIKIDSIVLPLTWQLVRSMGALEQQMNSLSRFLLESYCPRPTHKVTLTSVNSSGLSKSDGKFSAAQIATRRFLHMLDNRCWGHGRRRKGYVVGCIASVEGLGSWENWHVHLTLTSPAHLNYWRFYEDVLKSAAKVSAFGKEVDIKPYSGPEWVDYCFKTGSDSWLVECTRLAKP